MHRRMELCVMMGETTKQTKSKNMYTHTCTQVCMFALHTNNQKDCLRCRSSDNQKDCLLRQKDCLRSESESASHSSPPKLKGVRVISACVRARVLTAGVHAHKSGQTKKTDTFIHISEAYIRLCFHRKKRKDISTHAGTCTCACMSPP